MEHNYPPQSVNLDQIKFDTNNPRGESEEKILSDPKFLQLVTSIMDYGVLTPLIIKKDSPGYILIDGERRLRASRVAKRVNAPSLIVDSDIDGRILAYQVHMLRKDWSTINEARSLKLIVDEIKVDNPDITDAEFKKKIIEITNSDETQASDWIDILKNSEEVIEKVYNNAFPVSHLIRNERDFINKIKNQYPNILKKHPESDIRAVLANKAEHKLMGTTRYLMDTFKTVWEYKEKTNEIEKILVNFIETDSMKIDQAFDAINDLFKSSPSPATDAKPTESTTATDPSVEKPGTKTVTRKKDSKKTEKPTGSSEPKEGNDENFTYKKISISAKETKKLNDLRPKLEAIGKTFSDEEMEYISEALYCLEHNCFKAATLMIWSSGISKLLNYIEKNIPDFNSCCLTMKTSPKSVYKHFSKNFQLNITSVEDFKIQANDRQLLCYIFFKKCINDTQFNKLKANYDTRNDCAHPTAVTLSANEIITIFDNIYNLILSNKKIK